MKKLIRLPLSILSLLLQSAALAVGQIKSNIVRSTLTTLGIVIAVAAVTGVIAALTGLKSQVLSEFEAIGTNTIFVLSRRPQTGPHRYAPFHKIRFMPEDFDGLLENCPSILTYTFMSQYAQNVRFGEKNVDNCTIIGVNPSWHKIQSRSVSEGRTFSVVDQNHAWQVCLVTPELRNQLRLGRDCIGKSIFVGSRSFRIIGVVEENSTSFGMGQSPTEVIIPFETIWKIWEPGMYVIAASRTPELSSDAVAELRFYLRNARRLRPGEPDTFRLQAVEEVLQQFNVVAGIITAIASGIVGISLLVGGIGIMNIMLVSVSERTREIGLRKAVGARPSAILLQFLVESIVLCLLGGLIGLGGGQLLTLAIAKIPNADIKAYIPLWAVGLAFGFSGVVGVFFGMFPAVKAALLDPIEALRHE